MFPLTFLIDINIYYEVSLLSELCSNCCLSICSVQNFIFCLPVSKYIVDAFYPFDISRRILSGPNQEDDIASLIQDRSVTYLASGRFIKCFKRGRPVWTIEDGGSEVLLILLIGECIISVSSENALKIWNKKSKGS